MKLKSFEEQVYLAQLISPESGPTTQTVPATYIDMGQFERAVFLISAGALGAAATLDAQVVQATDSAGTGSKNIAGAAITQLTATDDDKYATIEVQADQLDIANGFTHVAVTVTIANTVDIGVYFLGFAPRDVPVTQPAAYAEKVQLAG